MSFEQSAIHIVSLEDKIRYLRFKRSLLVATLDERVETQRMLIKEALAARGWSLAELLESEDEDLDAELKLCRQAWLDCDYIDYLR